jgi:hypothetical protein
MKNWSRSICVRRRRAGRLIFVVAVPRQLITDYLICVGALARLTRDGATRTALLQAQTTAGFLEELRAQSALLG